MKKYFFAVILGICFLSSVGAQSVKVFHNEGFILLGNFNMGLGGRILQSFDLDISKSWIYPRFGALVGVSTLQGYEEYGSHNDKISSFNLSVYGELPLPISIGNFVISPYIRGLLKSLYFFDTPFILLGYGLSGGIRTGYIFDFVGIYLNIGYEFDHFFHLSQRVPSDLSHGINFSVGVSL